MASMKKTMTTGCESPHENDAVVRVAAMVEIQRVLDSRQISEDIAHVALLAVLVLVLDVSVSIAAIVDAHEGIAAVGARAP